MRIFLIKLSGITAILLAAASLAHADVLVRNKDGKTRQISISRPVGRTTTDLPPNGMMLIRGSEGVVAVQLQDKDGNPVGARVAITDGDKITIKGGALERTAGEIAAE